MLIENKYVKDNHMLFLTKDLSQYHIKVKAADQQFNIWNSGKLTKNPTKELLWFSFNED